MKPLEDHEIPVGAGLRQTGTGEPEHERGGVDLTVFVEGPRSLRGLSHMFSVYLHKAG